MKQTTNLAIGAFAIFTSVFIAGVAEAQQRMIPVTPEVRAQMKCQQEVRRQVPRIHEPGAERRRSHLYRLCMHRKGFRP